MVVRVGVVFKSGVLETKEYTAADPTACPKILILVFWVVGTGGGRHSEPAFAFVSAELL